LQKIIFITGTDTSVGKTVLTALLLSHFSQSGHSALAIKPFCSGGRADAELLLHLQGDALKLNEINPFYFPDPVAPLVAARKRRRQIPMNHVLRHIQSLDSRLSKIENLTLLIEGAGGLLSPLGEPKNSDRFKVQSSRFKSQRSNYYTALDLINSLNCCVIVVAPNRLGAINHTLLSVRALRASKSQAIRVVLMDINEHPSRKTQHVTRFPSRNPQPATRSNPSIIAELLAPTPLFRIPDLGKNPGKPERIHIFAKKCKKTLAQILA
jgi:dethiobiotin synthetase